MDHVPVTVLILAPVHRPFGNRVIREGEALARAGYDVTAIMRTDAPGIHGGIKVVPGPAHASRLARFSKIPLVLLRALRHRADIYHAHNPDMIPVAFLLGLAGRTVIYDTHENYRHRLELRDWVPRPLRPILGRLVGVAEISLSRRAQATFVTQPRMLEEFGPRTRLLRNAPKTDRAHMERIARHHADLRRGDGSRLIYVGSLSRSRGLETMLTALETLNRTMPVRLWLAGPAVGDALDVAEAHPGWRFVDHLGLLPHELALAYAKAADIGLAVLGDIGDHRTARPTKLFEYMSVGTPFVASDFPDWRGAVGPGAGGVWIEPGDPARLAAELRDLLPDPGRMADLRRRGLDFAATFNWERESEILLETYAALREAR